MNQAPRESLKCDVLIIGAGPAGLSAAIRLKQILGDDVSVIVIEKGSEVGAHILSGAVIDPIGLDRLLPDWRDDGTCPLVTAVNDDRFYLLGAGGGVRVPHMLMPPFMSNKGCYTGSLGLLCRWLGQKAESLGVEIYAGFAGAEVLYDDNGVVKGVATGDMGIGKDGQPTPNFTPGIELHAAYTLFAEGARGQLSRQVIEHFKLHRRAGPPKFGLGLKELWKVKPEKHHPGRIQHTMGWPLDSRTGGGSFLYHLEDGLVAVGFVVHLNYANPSLSPFEEFQRLKHHPLIADTLEGGKRLSYGARAITEGGYQSVPKLAFPGGALLGCAAGFVNVPRIKGSHNAMLSGILCADHVSEALRTDRFPDALQSYEAAWRNSDIGKDLWKVRNVKPLWSRFGTYAGLVLGGLDMWSNTLGFSVFGTLKHTKTDRATLKPARRAAKINYPKPDGVLSFDKLSSVFLSGTLHEENQPVHLRVQDMQLQLESEWGKYGGPSQHYCPAGVYEWVQAEGQAAPHYVINAQNCVHCKTCDIKDPNNNILWVAPEGGGGPNYPNM
jgi:electron-transferring-flavoprotein dehydrogenase